MITMYYRISLDIQKRTANDEFVRSVEKPVEAERWFKRARAATPRANARGAAGTADFPFTAVFWYIVTHKFK